MPLPSPSRQAEPKPDRHWSESRTFGTVVVALLLFVSVAVVWQHVQSRSRLRAEVGAQSQLRAAQVTSATAEAVSILFRTVDATARELAIVYAQHGPRVFGERANEAIDRLPAGAVTQLAVIGPDGYLAYSNLSAAERVFLGDREHFRVHLGGESDKLYISKPLLGRVSRQWSIQFSRRIVRDGRFAGVVVLSVSPTYLQQALSAISLQSDDAITVLRQSGEFLARNQGMEATLGRSSDPDRPFLMPGAPKSGAFVARSTIDKLERLSHWQRLDDYPVVVVLGLSAKATFEPVERATADDNILTGAGLAVLWSAGIGTLLLARRINAQVRRRKEAEFVATYDSLTGLHSRLALMKHLEESVSHPDGSEHRFGLLFLDLDGFKPVNDRYGHAAGDEVLKAVGGRIKGCVRARDLVARIGGDEFVVVLDTLSSDHELTDLRERIAHALQAPIAAAGVEVTIGASMGEAVFPDHGTTPDALLKHADRGMYAEKGQKNLPPRGGDSPA